MSQVDPLFQAISFAARAHRHQLRKDGQTPYAAHPFRVLLIVRHLFGVDDPQILSAAVLHDTIEDTTTDYDDIAEQFGEQVAEWVADLTKEMRLPEATREANYHHTLSKAAWPVVVCKLADIYDNISDSGQLSAAKRLRTLTRSEHYLQVLRGNLTHPLAKAAFELTEALCQKAIRDCD